MERNFHRVSRSLCSDSGRRSIWGILVCLALAAIWIWWALAARVSSYEISESARVEVGGSGYPVQADLSGQVLSSALAIGKEVERGDALLVLDPAKERLALAEENAKLAALRPQLTVLRAELESQAKGGTDERQVLRWSTKGALAKYQEADAQAVLAESEAHRAMLLQQAGIIAQAEEQRAEATARRYRAAADSLRISMGSLQPQLRVREADRELHVKEIYSDMAKLEAQEQASAAVIQQLEYEIRRRTVRASASGKLIECADLRPGAYVSEGQKLGVIASQGNVEVVAHFLPAAAFGKLHAGQHAVLKLNGFPWTQYGTIAATVSRVAGEIRDGQVKVELAVDTAHASRIPLQHGAPGTVEVLTDRISPAALLLRSAGHFVGAH
jgi:membrane fusion protein (multidrug efflux system)